MDTSKLQNLLVWVKKVTNSRDTDFKYLGKRALAIIAEANGNAYTIAKAYANANVNAIGNVNAIVKAYTIVINYTCYDIYAYYDIYENYCIFIKYLELSKKWQIRFSYFRIKQIKKTNT